MLQIRSDYLPVCTGSDLIAKGPERCGICISRIATADLRYFASYRGTVAFRLTSRAASARSLDWVEAQTTTKIPATRFPRGILPLHAAFPRTEVARTARHWTGASRRLRGNVLSG